MFSELGTKHWATKSNHYILQVEQDCFNIGKQHNSRCVIHSILACKCNVRESKPNCFNARNKKERYVVNGRSSRQRNSSPCMQTTRDTSDSINPKAEVEANGSREPFLLSPRLGD